MVELSSKPFSPEERIPTLEKRAARVVETARKRIDAYGWTGNALSEGGAIEEVLDALANESLPALVRHLENYRDEKGRGFFAEKPGVLDTVLADLALVYAWDLGQEYNNPKAFSGEKPEEWDQDDYWKLAQAVACRYPNNNNANPFVQILKYAVRGNVGMFERCLRAGEDEDKEKGSYGLIQPIEPKKLGLQIEGLRERLSVRQALGQLVVWKAKEK